MNYEIGQVIKSKRVNYRIPRIAALLVLGLGLALGFARVGTTIITRIDDPKPKPAVVCGVMGCHGNNPHIGGAGGGAGGGGTIHVGS